VDARELARGMSVKLRNVKQLVQYLVVRLATARCGRASMICVKVLAKLDARRLLARQGRDVKLEHVKQHARHLLAR